MLILTLSDAHIPDRAIVCQSSGIMYRTYRLTNIDTPFFYVGFAPKI